jgi:cytoskeletal protein RodZ
LQPVAVFSAKTVESPSRAWYDYHIFAMEVSMKKPFYKRWWFWLIVAIVGVGTIGVINDSLSPPGDPTTVAAAATLPETSADDPAKSTAPAPTFPTLPASTTTITRPSATTARATAAVTTKATTTATKPATTTKAPDTAAPTAAPPSGNAEYNGRAVYTTPSGKKYHYANPCGNGTYGPATLDQALAAGLEPCEKCVLQ